MDYLGLCIIIVIIISNVDNSSVNHVYLHKTIDLRLNQILHLQLHDVMLNNSTAIHIYRLLTSNYGLVSKSTSLSSSGGKKYI